MKASHLARRTSAMRTMQRTRTEMMARKIQTSGVTAATPDCRPRSPLAGRTSFSPISWDNRLVQNSTYQTIGYTSY